MKLFTIYKYNKRPSLQYLYHGEIDSWINLQFNTTLNLYINDVGHFYISDLQSFWFLLIR